MKVDSTAAQTVYDARMRWTHCFCYICLVLSIPWFVWGIKGWFGLLLHFQAASGGASLLERVLRGRQLLRKSE